MEIIGVIAGFLTTASFIPQVWKVVKTKDTSALSLIFALAINSGTALWLVYGIYLQNVVIIISNAIVFSLSAVIVFYKIRNILTKEEKI